MRALSIAACVLLSGCLRDTAFRCATDAECGVKGTCQTDVGYCSEADVGCASGLRFGASAGAYANQCVGEIGAPDAGLDAPGDDAASDAATDAPIAALCPAEYVTITGGQGTHRYRLVNMAENWQAQRAFCAATSTAAYLAIPDDQNELNAIQTLGAATQVWVGITDAATENTWLNVKGMPQTFLPWDTGQPNDVNPGQDCVAVQNNRLRDERCSSNYRAVCECEP
jgi:hypothetical protein